MSDFNLFHKSNIKARQLDYLSQKGSREIDAHAETQDIQGLALSLEETYAERAGTPLFQKRRAERHQLPFREDFIENMREITEDIRIISDEHQHSSTFLRDSFNDIHSEKKNLTARINELNNLTSQLGLITGEDDANVIYAKESFQNTSAMDKDFAVDSVSKADIHTGEGVLSLKRASSLNLSEQARVAQVTGNGTPGVHHIARRHSIINQSNQVEEAYRMVNTDDKTEHALKESMLDSRPDTIFEYQMVNVPERFKQDRRFYDFTWSKGAEEDDRLRLKLVVELDKEETLNWITLDPYYANSSSGTVILKSIKTSLNGFDYESIYEGHLELNQKINATAQTYRLADIFTGENRPEEGTYSGQGVWSFPQKSARFVEFVLEQSQSYNEVIGQDIYYVIRDQESHPIQVPAPEELKDMPAGDYIRHINGERITYRKEIHATTEGWRYAIGVRDIGLMQYTYDQKSHFVSKPFEAPREIERLVLYTKEIIPESYLDIVSKNNDWIQYEVSFNDMDWYRISPMHQEPLNDAFPPKILEVNKTAIDLTRAFEVHKAKIEEEDPVQVRLKITLQRPEEDGFENTTPLVEEVALKIDLKEEF